MKTRLLFAIGLVMPLSFLSPGMVAGISGATASPASPVKLVEVTSMAMASYGRTSDVVFTPTMPALFLPLILRDWLPYSSHGIVGESFVVPIPIVNVGDMVWYGFTVTNSLTQTVEFSALGAHADQGYTASEWPWTMQRLKAGQTLMWRDYTVFDKAGLYQLYLGICFAGSVEACKTAQWDRLSPNISITVQ